MRIRKVTIENFRSIEHLEFYPSDLCALVGENNAGKSNILGAIDFVLGESWPSRQRLDPSDFFNIDTTRTIHIEIEFHPNPYDYDRIWFRAPPDDKAETRVQYEGSSKGYYLSSEVRDQCAVVYLDANRDLEYHLRESSWALFGRIIRELDKDFKDTAGEARIAELDGTFNQAKNILQTELFSSFEEGVHDTFTNQLRRTSHTIELDFKTFDPLNYYRSINIHLRENGERRSLLESGQGMRNLILLALFRTYAKVFKDDAIIAVEEPEIFLHPHTQRSLYSLFLELTSAGSQIFYSTHSGTFVSVDRFDEVYQVRKESSPDHGESARHTSIIQVSANRLLNRRQELHPDIPMNEDSLRERYLNIMTLAHNEAFFSRMIVLVEGSTEAEVIPIFAEAMGHDFNALGVSVVNAHGKTNLDQLYHLYESFKIPIYLVFDGDRGTDDEDKRRWNRILLRMLSQAESEQPESTITSSYAIFEEDFETMMQEGTDQLEAGLYAQLETEAKELLGTTAGKALVGRYIARRLTNRPEPLIPPSLNEIITNAVELLEETSTQASVNSNDQELEEETKI